MQENYLLLRKQIHKKKNDAKRPVLEQNEPNIETNTNHSKTMPHLYQQPSSQDQHPAGYPHGGAVPPPQTAGAPQQTAQHLMTMLPPPPHVSATQQAAAAQHPQITPPHPYSTNPYGVATPGAGAGAGTSGSSAAIPPPMAMHPHHAAAYQAGFASAQAHAAQHVANLQAAQAQQAQSQKQAQHAQHAQIHAAMYGIPAAAAAAAAGQQHHHPHHHAHLPYRPSAVPPSSLAGQDASSVTISPVIKREDSGSITGTSMDHNDGRASAEDIAVSALSMLCGAALGEVKVKKEEDADEAEMQGQTKTEGGAVRVEGSPSFVEESKKTTTDGAAPATDVTTATSAAAAAHISPASTVGSEGTPADSVKQVVVVDHAAAAGANASASDATGKPMAHFPSLLHDVLTNSRHAGSVLEWLPHGQGWRVLRWDEMARTVLPEHFPQFCSSLAATKEDATSTSEKTKKEKEEDGENGDRAASKTKAKQLRRKPPMLPLRSKAEETSSKGAGDGDVNAFLSHVRAWGFQEVRDGGPDMGSYRHAVSVEVELLPFFL